MVNIPVLNFVKGQYDVIREAIEGALPLASVQARCHILTEQISEADVTKFGAVFLRDVYNSEESLDMFRMKLNGFVKIFSTTQKDLLIVSVTCTRASVSSLKICNSRVILSGWRAVWVFFLLGFGMLNLRHLKIL